MRKILFLIAAPLLVILIFAAKVVALGVGISNNGTGSQNSINVNSSKTSNIDQSNTAEVQNDVGAGANTGGNSISGNTEGNTRIDTGNAKTSVSVKNNLNKNSANVPGCCPGPAGPPPIGGVKPPPPPPPAPAGPPPSGDGGVTAAAAAARGDGLTEAAKGAKVLGLSATSGEGREPYIFYFAGALCLLAGSRLILSKS